MGFGIKSKNDAGYWDDFIIEWLFYFFIMLVMLNIINGIVVDTFQDLREKNSEQQEIRNNSCFICSLHRSEFESKGIDYEEHIANEHSIENYFQYIFKINNTENKDEFSSCEYDIYQKIRRNVTDFFPVMRSITLDRIKSKE